MIVDPERERWRTLALRASLATGAAIALTSVSALLQREPADNLTIWTLAGLVLGAFALPAFVVVAVVQRRPILVLAPLVGTAVFVGVGSVADDLHWRWSRDEFAEAAASTDPSAACPGDAGCALGWWDVERIERTDDLIVVWGGETAACYAGWALARPADGTDHGRVTEAAGVIGPSIFVEVDPWWDGWSELCYTT